MKIVHGRRLAFIAAILLLIVSTPVATGAVDWKTGHLTSIEISGTGVPPQTTARAGQKDLWWMYGICTDDRTYYAALRLAPAKLGLGIDSTVRFSATRSQLTLLDSSGKPHILRIFRQDNSKGCGSR